MSACIISIIGTWISLLANNIEVKIIGQLIVDAGYPLVIGCVTKVTAVWFPYKERFYATSFAIMGGIGGYAVGDTSAEVFGIGTPINYAIFITVILGVSIMLLLVAF